MKLKRNDKVIILTGKDRNKIAEIERVFVSENKAVVKGLNIYKKVLSLQKNHRKVELLRLVQKLILATWG